MDTDLNTSPAFPTGSSLQGSGNFGTFDGAKKADLDRGYGTCAAEAPMEYPSYFREEAKGGFLGRPNGYER